MAANGAGTSAGHGTSTTTIHAASTAIASADTTRFQPHLSHNRRSRWTGCLGGLSCFGSQKVGGKRIVPASRTTNSTLQNSSQSTIPNQNTNLINNLSLIAPPSSPASFTNSALPSTSQSPTCFLSPPNASLSSSNMMFATGPYAHETQLVSPPVFSTFTTEPSTAPLTPPPELAQLTTPSSPDVPYARFLSSKEKGVPFNDLQANYPLYISTSPSSSSLISPANSVTPRTGLSSPLPEHEEPLSIGIGFPYSSARNSALSSTCGSPYGRNAASKLFVSAPESPFFRPAACAQFYLDQAQQRGGRQSVSREKQEVERGGRASVSREKQEVEEVEAYRASFGFSADEVTTMQKYMGVSEAADDSFTMYPFGNDSISKSPHHSISKQDEERKMQLEIISKHDDDDDEEVRSKDVVCNSSCQDVHPFVKHKEEKNVNIEKSPESSKRGRLGQSCSDAEIEYRRGRSLRENNGISVWRNSLP